MNLKIKLFADGANIEEMYQLYVDGKVQGFTTNPTLMRKAGITNYETFAKKTLEIIPDVPISFEVFTDNLDEMKKQARKISSWGKNVYVKIPITNSEGTITSRVIKQLSEEGIKINVTAVLTLWQFLCSLHSVSKNTPSIISVFAGRIADTGRDPMITMKKSRRILKNNPNCEILWASTRELYNIIQAEECGCDIITITPDILKKIPMIGKDLDELSIDTVKMFYNDAKEAGYKYID